MNRTLSVVVGSVAVWSAIAYATSDIRTVDFQNYAYRPNLCTRAFAKEGIGKTVKVRKGEWNGKSAYYQISDIVLYADLDGDGREEAVIQTYCALNGANYSLSEVFVFGMRGEEPSVIASLDEAQLQTTYERQNPGGHLWSMGSPELQKDGKTIVFRAPADGPHGSPESEITFVYGLVGGNLVPMQKPQKQPFKG